MAEYLDVTEGFLRDALIAYRNKYGTYVKCDNFAVIFVPTLDVKIFHPIPRTYPNNGSSCFLYS